MKVAWDQRGAVEAKARIAAERAAGACPNCFAPSTVALIDVSTDTECGFVAGLVDCSERCYEIDPDGYIAATSTGADRDLSA